METEKQAGATLPTKSRAPIKGTRLGSQLALDGTSCGAVDSGKRGGAQRPVISGEFEVQASLLAQRHGLGSALAAQVLLLLRGGA